MAFNLPTQQNLHTSASSNNRGVIGSASSLGTKSGGNLPISTNASQIINSTGSSATGAPAGVFFGMDGSTSTSTYDATQESRVLLWSLQYNAPNRIQSSDLANGGSRFWLGSGATPSANYKEFFIGGNDTPFCASQAGPVTICIDIADSTNDNFIGSFDPTQVSAYGHASVRRNLVGGSTTQIYFQRSFLFTTTKGSSNLPTFTGVSNFDDAIARVQGDNYTNKIGSWLTKSGSSFFIPCPFSFGNGSDAVDFDDLGVSVVSPAGNSPKQENFRITDNAMRIYFDPRDNAADSVTLSGAYAWGTAAAWDFDISNNAVATLSGNFSGMGEFKLGNSITANGNFNLASGFAVISNGAFIDGITVTGDLNLSTDVQNNLTSVTVGGALDFDTAGTYTLTGCVIQEVTNSSGGNVIINNAGSTINANTGPNISIVAPPSQLTLTNLQVDTEIRVYEAGTINELAGVENSTNTFTTPLAAASVDVRIFNIQYKPITLRSVDTTQNVSLPIQQQIEPNQLKN